MIRTILTVLVIILGSPTLAAADIIIFKSGSAKIGIVEEENSRQVTIRDKDRVVTIMRANIEKIEYSTEEENRQLRFKWEEEKRRLAEKRKEREEAQKKFEAEQKAKGLIEVDGKWLSVGEAEARRQQQIQQQVQRQRQQAAAEKETEATEEIELPEYADDLTEEQKALLREDLKRREKITVGKIQMVDLGSGRVQLKGMVTNGSDMTANEIALQITFYGEDGQVLDFEDTTVYSVQPGATGSFHAMSSVDAELIKRTEAEILSVNW